MQKKEQRNFYNEVDIGKKGKFLETNISYIVQKWRKYSCMGISPSDRKNEL